MEAADAVYGPLKLGPPNRVTAAHIAYVFRYIEEKEAEIAAAKKKGGETHNYVITLISRLYRGNWGPLEDPKVTKEFIRTSIINPLRRTGKISPEGYLSKRALEELAEKGEEDDDEEDKKGKKKEKRGRTKATEEKKTRKRTKA